MPGPCLAIDFPSLAEPTLEKLQQLCLDRWTPNVICIPATSGRAVLLLLQTHRRETGRSSLLPGFPVVAQGVHASPKVTSSCCFDGFPSLLKKGWPRKQLRPKDFMLIKVFPNRPVHNPFPASHFSSALLPALSQLTLSDPLALVQLPL